MAKWKSTSHKGVRYREHPTRKQGDAQYDRYYAVRYQRDGERHELGLGWASEGMTESKAALMLAQCKKAARTGGGPVHRNKTDEKRAQKQALNDREARENGTFGELMAEYLEWARSNKRHWSNDEYRYRAHLAEYLEDVPLKGISAVSLERIKNKLSGKKLAPATVTHCLAIVRQAFNKAVLWGRWEGKNPLQGVKLPSSDNRKERTLTYEEEQRLMPLLRKKSPRAWAMAMASLYGGLRFEEIAKLRRQNIDFEQGLIRVDGKGGRARAAPMNQTLRGVFEECCPPALAPFALLFPDRNGHPQKKVSHSFWRAVAEAGLNHDAEDRRYRLDFQGLRHTWATRLGNQGVTINVLRDLGGWSDFQMVSRYCKSEQESARAAAYGLDCAPEESKALEFIRQSEAYRHSGSDRPQKPQRLSRLQDRSRKDDA